MMRAILLPVTILIMSSSLAARTGRIDSLRQRLSSVQDTQYVLTLSDLCWEFRLVDQDSALNYGQQALSLARRLKYAKGEAQALNDLGIIHIDRSEYSAALDHFTRALQIRQGLGDSAGVAAIYNKQGIVHQKQGRLDAALDRQLRALRIYEQRKEDLHISYTLNNIAIIHFNLGNRAKSLEYHERALMLRLHLKDDYGIGASYGNMANVYLESGDTVKALNHISKALEYLRKVGGSEALGVQLNNMGAILAAQGKVDSAAHYLLRALEIRQGLGDNKAIASTMGSLGEVYYRQGRYRQAEDILQRALGMARQAEVKEEQINILSRLSTVYEATGKHSLALEALREHNRVREEVYNDQVNARILEMQERFEATQKEQRIALLTSEQELDKLKIGQQRFQITLLLGFLVMLLGTAFFEYYRYRQRQRSVLQREMIRQQEMRMNAVIEAQEMERKRIAEDLHDGVGQTLSGLKLVCEGISAELKLEGEARDHISKLSHALDEACSEVRTLSHEMRPKALNELGLIPSISEMLSRSLRPSGIAYNFEHVGMEERYPEKIEVSLYRISQELVNNIIRHSQAREVGIQLFRNKQLLVMVVEDDGRGFIPEGQPSKGIGMLNMVSRVNAVGGEINFESSPGQGTVVTLRIPV
ncbi:MAG: tetratricopeptide repeat protein [Bacteroidales bacterium]|nr:tetratricopeptide repeat protein [Bacteroidales bacterium]